MVAIIGAPYLTIKPLSPIRPDALGRHFAAAAPPSGFLELRSVRYGWLPIGSDFLAHGRRREWPRFDGTTSSCSNRNWAMACGGFTTLIQGTI